MLRNAVIIASENSETGCNKSACTLWCEFLKSNAGGGWYTDEIVCPDSTSKDVLTAINATRHADFSLIVFIGQGTLVKEDRPWTEMRIQLNETETLLADQQLNNGASYLTLVLDCFQTFSKSKESELILSNRQLEAENSDSSFFREIYEKEFLGAERGLTKIYSDSIKQRRLPVPPFSYFLINGAYEWSDSHERGAVLSWNDAVTVAQIGMQACHIPEESRQIIYQGGRRLRHFPMAVGNSARDVDAK